MKTILILLIGLVALNAAETPVGQVVAKRARTIPLDSTNGAPAKVLTDVRRLEPSTITHTTNSSAYRRHNP